MPLNPTAVYQRTAVETAPKGRLLTMLYDRLVRDLEEAQRSIKESRAANAHVSLVHAQDIVNVLYGALDVKAWPDGRNLAEIYRYLAQQLVAANLSKDVRKVEECLMIVRPLRDAWHVAYNSAGEQRQ